MAAATPTADQALLIRDYSPSLAPPMRRSRWSNSSIPPARPAVPFTLSCRKSASSFPTQVRVVLRYTVFHEGSDEAVRILEAARMQDKFEPVLDAI